MSNFSTKLEDATDKQLKDGLDMHAPQYAILESDELTRRTLNELRKTIDTFNKQSSKQTEKMIRMTEITTKLTFAVAIFTLVQLAILLWQSAFSLQQSGLNWITVAYALFLLAMIWFVFKKGDILQNEIFPKKISK